MFTLGTLFFLHVYTDKNKMLFFWTSSSFLKTCPQNVQINNLRYYPDKDS